MLLRRHLNGSAPDCSPEPEGPMLLRDLKRMQLKHVAKQAHSPTHSLPLNSPCRLASTLAHGHSLPLSLASSLAMRQELRRATGSPGSSPMLLRRMQEVTEHKELRQEATEHIKELRERGQGD